MAERMNYVQKAARRFLLKRWIVILGFFAGFFSSTGCHLISEDTGGESYMYAPPTFLYNNVVTGMVISAETEKPIPGISVTIDEWGDSGVTDSNGKYSITVGTDTPEDTTYTVHADDIDGTDNGSFSSEEATIVITVQEATDGSDENLDFTLNPSGK